MIEKNKVSIYLIKEGIKEEIIIKDYNSFKENDEYYNHKKIIFDQTKTAFYLDSKNSKPTWIRSFYNNNPRFNKIYTSNAKLVLLVKIHDPYENKIRIFAITQGHGKSLLTDNVIENNFGLKILLNTVNRADLRKINRTTVAGNLKATNEQLPLTGAIDEFGIDIDRDLVTTITAKIKKDPWFVGMITGGDILNVSAKVDLTNIEEFLLYCIEKYHSDSYKTDFGWIDNISHVKDKVLLNELDKILVENLNSNENKFGIAVPEIIDWIDFDGFQIAGNPSKLDDLSIDELKNSFKNSLVDSTQLKSKYVTIVDTNGEKHGPGWNTYRCIFGEIEYNGHDYCINNGKWYCIDNNFKEKIINDYNSTEISQINFDIYQHKTENLYSTEFCKNHNEQFICLDKKNVMYGGGHSQVEICDILSKSNELIHIKPYSSSSTLSHLFNQGLVSIDLIMHDDDFLKSANKIIEEENPNYLINDSNRNDMKVVFAIAHTKGDSLPEIPFFSKVALKHVKKRIKEMNGKIEIKRINRVK